MPPKSRNNGTWIGVRRKCATWGTATPYQTVERLCGTAGFHMKTFMIYKLGAMQFATQNDLYQ